MMSNASACQRDLSAEERGLDLVLQFGLGHGPRSGAPGEEE